MKSSLQKNGVSSGWRPSHITRQVLLSKGYWDLTISALSMEFLGRQIENDQPLDPDIDSQFARWVTQRMPNPVCVCALAAWQPSKQLLYHLAMGVGRLNDLLSLYRQAVQGRGEAATALDHDAAFLAFVNRWTANP